MSAWYFLLYELFWDAKSPTDLMANGALEGIYSIVANSLSLILHDTDTNRFPVKLCLFLLPRVKPHRMPKDRQSVEDVDYTVSFGLAVFQR
jgi:hypothetical protein